MGSMDFYIDFNIEVPNVENEFTREAERQLRELAAGHTDLIGAAVSLESLVKTETPFLYQVRIVVYKRPEDLAVIEKEATPRVALNRALEVLEEKIRVSREKLSYIDSHRNEEIETLYYELAPDEIYATFAKNLKPTEVIHKDRDEIASELMVEEGLTEKAAYFAADQILFVAHKNANEGET